jgi:hypothetical protein
LIPFKPGVPNEANVPLNVDATPTLTDLPEALAVPPLDVLPQAASSAPMASATNTTIAPWGRLGRVANPIPVIQLLLTFCRATADPRSAPTLTPGTLDVHAKLPAHTDESRFSSLLLRLESQRGSEDEAC